MALARIHFATEVMNEFVLLSPGQQRVIVFVMARRAMKREGKPSNFISYQDIADETGLSMTSIRLYIRSLIKEGWLKEYSRRKQEGEQQFRWTLPKQDQAWELTYARESEQEFESYEAEAEANGWLFADGIFWREGGPLGFQSRNPTGRFWKDASQPPSFVANFFLELPEKALL